MGLTRARWDLVFPTKKSPPPENKSRPNARPNFIQQILDPFFRNSADINRRQSDESHAGNVSELQMDERQFSRYFQQFGTRNLRAFGHFSLRFRKQLELEYHDGAPCSKYT